MEVLENRPIKDSIKTSLEKGMSYKAYLNMLAELVETQSTTGNEKTKALIDYTLLNDRRMKRWDKTIKITDELKERISNFKNDVTWLVLSESWCGDAAHVLPAINKVAEASASIHLKIVLRDENEALMNQFLTNGGKSIPKLIMIDNNTNEVIGTYGPRPSGATKLVNDHKAKYGQLTPEFKEELQQWYNKDKGQNTITELVALLAV